MCEYLEDARQNKQQNVDIFLTNTCKDSDTNNKCNNNNSKTNNKKLIEKNWD